MADELKSDESQPFDAIGVAQCEPLPKLHPFVKWFGIALGIQFIAWLLMVFVYPLRPIYFSAYLPFFFIFPGPHYPRYGLAFFCPLPSACRISYLQCLGRSDRHTNLRPLPAAAHFRIGVFCR